MTFSANGSDMFHQDGMRPGSVPQSGISSSSGINTGMSPGTDVWILGQMVTCGSAGPGDFQQGGVTNGTSEPPAYIQPGTAAADAVGGSTQPAAAYLRYRPPTRVVAPTLRGWMGE